MDHEIEALFDLIDDENEQSATLAMAELLRKNSPALDSILCSLQESANPRMRRRVHQLQSAIGMRRRRHLAGEGFRTHNMPLLNGLIHLHLLWFDNDLQEAILEQWNELVTQCRGARISSLERLGFFMHKQRLLCPVKENSVPDHFCFGAVLEDQTGSDIILASIALLLAKNVCGLSLRLVLMNADFCLMDEKENLLLPCTDWKYVPSGTQEGVCNSWNDEMILRYVASMLFSASVAGDGFRYLYTLGECLAGNPEDELDFLPYPYNTQRRGKKG